MPPVEDLSAWIAQVAGRPPTSVRRRPGGGRHQAYDVVVDDGAGCAHELFLRADATEPPPWEHYTLRREAAIYRALHPTAVPVPAVLALHERLPAVLMEKAPGEARFSGLEPGVQQDIIDTFVPILFALHSVDALALDLPGVVPAASITEAVIHEVDIWERRLLDSAGPEPFVVACLAWLRANVPDVGDLPVLVQGDTGPGNFLHDGHQVTAVLDWELAHLGDPVEDLAWVATRNAQEPVPDFDRLIADYEHLTGPVDERRLRYHMVFAETRIAILAAARETGHRDPRGEVGNGLIYGALHKRLTVEAVADVLSVELAVLDGPDGPDDHETAQTPLFDAALLQLREIVLPAIEDPFASARAKSLARVLKYLRGVDRYRSRHSAEERAELGALLGRPITDVDAARTELVGAVRAGRLGVAELLEPAWGAVRREHQALGDAMGVLAQRHLPGRRPGSHG